MKSKSVFDRAEEDLDAKLASTILKIKDVDLKDERNTKPSALETIGCGIFVGDREASYLRYKSEWQTDQAFLDDEQFRLVKEDPDFHFLDWLSKRVVSAAWLSVQARSWALQRHPTLAMDLELNVWLPELMWAFKMRSHPDMTIAVMAGLWYRQAMEDTTTWFQKVVDAYLNRMVSDAEYENSTWRKLNWRQVKELEDIPEDWTPCWLKLARVDKKIGKVATLDEARLQRASDQSHIEYRVQRDRLVGENVAGLFFRTRPARMPGIIDAALDAGWGPQQLVDAERLFGRLLFTGQIAVVDVGGFGYREFSEWILSKPAETKYPTAADVSKMSLEQYQALEQRRLKFEKLRAAKFLTENVDIRRRMLPDYEAFDAVAASNFQEWRKWVTDSGEYPESSDEREENWQDIKAILLSSPIKGGVFRAGRSSAFDRVGQDRRRVVERDGSSYLDADERDHPLAVFYGWFLLRKQRLLRRRS